MFTCWHLFFFFLLSKSKILSRFWLLVDIIHTFFLRYYSFDAAVIREIFGHKLNARSRKDLDAISEEMNVPLRSCRRQVRIFHVSLQILFLHGKFLFCVLWIFCEWWMIFGNIPLLPCLVILKNISKCIAQDPSSTGIVVL